MLLTALFLVLFSSFNLDAKEVFPEPSFTKLDVFKEPDALQPGERFFKINKSSFPTNVTFNERNLERWEKVFGPLKKKTSPLKSVPIDQLKENAIVEGATIHFYDVSEEKVKSYTFGKFIKVCLLESIYDNPHPSPYLGYAILLSDSLNSCSDLRYGTFESLGYIGNRFKISNSVVVLDVTSTISRPDPEDIAKIKEQLRKTTDLSAEEVNKLQVAGDRIGNSQLYSSFLLKKINSQFLKHGKNKIIYWDSPQRNKGTLYRYNTWVTDSLLTGIYTSLMQSYLLVFYEDKVLKFLLEERDMSMFI